MWTSMVRSPTITSVPHTWLSISFLRNTLPGLRPAATVVQILFWQVRCPAPLNVTPYFHGWSAGRRFLWYFGFLCSIAWTMNWSCWAVLSGSNRLGEIIISTSFKPSASVASSLRASEEYDQCLLECWYHRNWLQTSIPFFPGIMMSRMIRSEIFFAFSMASSPFFAVITSQPCAWVELDDLWDIRFVVGNEDLVSFCHIGKGWAKVLEQMATAR